MVALWCRGGTKNCPMAIADFVLLHNKASEGLVKHDRVGYDIYLGIADTKALFLKFCKAFEKRIRSMVPTYRVVPSGDGEGSTSVSIPGFLVDAKRLKNHSPLRKLNCNFLRATRSCTWNFIRISARVSTRRNQKLHCKTSRH